MIKSQAKPKAESSMNHWSTENEKDFITDLSTGKFYIRPSELEPTQMLKNYIKTAKHRLNNGLTPNIDWVGCITYAQELMEV